MISRIFNHRKVSVVKDPGSHESFGSSSSLLISVIRADNSSSLRSCRPGAAGPPALALFTLFTTRRPHNPPHPSSACPDLRGAESICTSSPPHHFCPAPNTCFPFRATLRPNICTFSINTVTGGSVNLCQRSGGRAGSRSDRQVLQDGERSAGVRDRAGAVEMITFYSLKAPLAVYIVIMFNCACPK